MAQKNDSLTPPKPLVIVVKRRFDSPAERVFDAWLDPDSAGRWLFATPGGVMHRVEIDPRVGGEFIVAEQRGDVLAEHYGRYVEIDRPRRLVFLFSVTKFLDPDEVVSRVTIEIAPLDGGCELTLTHEIDPKWAEYEERTRSGWNTILAGLAEATTADREIVSSRNFDAPRELVFRAFSDPDQLACWWGPQGFTNTFQEFDLRPDGVWRFTMHAPDGTDYHNESVFLEIVPPERIVYFHREPIHGFRMTMTFVEQADRTLLTWQMLFDSVEECAKVQSFILAANEQNFDRLAEHLRTMIGTAN